MKKLYACTAIIALVTTSAAHAATTLPKAMMGDWCLAQGAADEEVIYDHHKCSDDPFEGLTMRPDRYDEVDAKCKFTTVRKLKPGLFVVDVRCQALADGDGHPINQFWTHNWLIQITRNGQLSMLPRSQKP